MAVDTCAGVRDQCLGFIDPNSRNELLQRSFLNSALAMREQTIAYLLAYVLVGTHFNGTGQYGCGDTACCVCAWVWRSRRKMAWAIKKYMQTCIRWCETCILHKNVSVHCSPVFVLYYMLAVSDLTHACNYFVFILYLLCCISLFLCWIRLDSWVIRKLIIISRNMAFSRGI